MPFRYAIGPDPRPRELQKALEQHRRVAICGAPNTGKTDLVAGVEDRLVIHTDDWKELPWGDQPDRIIERCYGLEDFVVEGLQVARALRKGLDVDCLLWLVKPVAEQTPRQVATGKGAITIFEGIRDTLRIPIVIIP